jgi:hypothetical protein
VKVENDQPNYLKDFPSGALLVYRNREAFDQGNAPLRASAPLDRLGETEDEALVVVPSGFEAIQDEVLTEGFSKISIEQEFVKLPKGLTTSSGLRHTELLLWEREAFKEQIKFLSDVTGDNSIRIAWIQGPPGVGKSSATLSFIPNWTLEGWVVSWINISPYGDMTGFRVVGNTKTKFNMSSGNLSTWLNEPYEKHVTIVNGNHITVILDVERWYKNEHGRRLAVIVSSLTASKKNMDSLDVLYPSRRHVVPSWTLDEYFDALNNEEIWNLVKHNMEIKDESKEDNIRQKFFVAGASARYMFDFTTSDAIERFNYAIERVADFTNLLDLGNASDNVVHRLVGIKDGRMVFVSRFVAQQLAFNVGVQKFDNFVEQYRQQLNPSMIDWLFEMRFFALLNLHGGLAYTMDGKQCVWPNEHVALFDSCDPDLNLFKARRNMWLKPINWKQGGYDAVRLIFTKEETSDHGRHKCYFDLEFVQVTKADSHSLKLQYFNQLITNINSKDKGMLYCDNSYLDNQFVFEKLRIFIVNPNGTVTRIPAGKIEGTGTLTPFNWKKGQEEHMVEYAEIDTPINSCY